MLKKILRDPESIIVLCFIAVVVLIFIGGEDPILKKGVTDSYGATFFPNIFAAILLICSTAILYGRVKCCAKSEEAESKVRTPKELKMLFLLVLLCPILMTWCGFIVMSLVSITIFCKILSLSTKETAIISIGLTVGVYVLFDMILKVQLPTNVFF